MKGFPVLKRAVIPLDEELTMQLVGAGLGEDLDTPISKFVEFRREWILIDTNLANGRLGRKLSAAESVDVYLAAIGASRRPGKCRKFIRQLIRIIRQRIQILVLQIRLNWRCLQLQRSQKANRRLP